MTHCGVNRLPKESALKIRVSSYSLIPKFNTHTTIQWEIFLGTHFCGNAKIPNFAVSIFASALTR